MTTLVASLSLLGVSFSQITVSGTITTHEGDPVEGVIVNSGGTPNQTVTTDSSGFYSFSLPQNEDYTITPFKDDEHLNGVSTLDRVLIEKHVDGTDLLDSPYDIIAADVDKSDSVSIQDTFDLMNLILGITNVYPNNTSWRFVDADFVFANPQDPFSMAFPEVANLNNLNGDITDLDFIAVKIGDVNSTAISGPSNPTPHAAIIGKVYFDENNNCQEDSNEVLLSGWLIMASDSSGNIYYGATNSNGNYKVIAPPGTYTVSAIEPNALWDTCVDSFPGMTISVQVWGVADFGAQATDTCPNMVVDMSTPFLRRCFPNFYRVNYCNMGTQDATGTYIEVTLDSFFSNVSASIPWTSVNGYTYTFDIGDVSIGECDHFEITFDLDCNAVLGQTHCSSAHIYPEPPCTPVSPQWAGGDLEITVECDGTEVKFTATNHGDDMTEPVNYIVIEDIMIQMTGSFQLNSGQSVEIDTIANGSTWRLQANEVGHHPFETIASAAVEGCGVNGNGTFSLGFVNQYPFSDEEPFEDEDCVENGSSYDPNDKIGYPTGSDVEHFIEKGQDISYRIRFQNTGTDTAFNVVILDTLLSTLDPTTIRLQGASHPMEFDLTGNGVAKFTFPNIMLPDSDVNEPLSHGYVKFNISQKPGLELGTTIENEAAIYFDFNDPIITNRTLHTIGEPNVEVSSTEVFLPNVEINVFPNPFDTEATFELNGMEIRDGEIYLFNLQGGLVKTQRFNGNTFMLNGSSLDEGLYFFQIADSGQRIATGKILVK